MIIWEPFVVVAVICVHLNIIILTKYELRDMNVCPICEASRKSYHTCVWEILSGSNNRVGQHVLCISLVGQKKINK